MIYQKVLHLLDGKIKSESIWNILLFIRRTFDASEDFDVPADKVLQLHSPIFDGEMKIDGEVYIL